MVDVDNHIDNYNEVDVDNNIDNDGNDEDNEESKFPL